MFTELDQPRIGEYLAPGLPVSIDGAYPPRGPAPALGDDTGGGAARIGWGSAADEIDALHPMRAPWR